MSIATNTKYLAKKAGFSASTKRGYTAFGLELLHNNCLVAWLTQVFDCRHKAITKRNSKGNQWKTRVHPISFREMGELWESDEFLVGVRFENDTEYAMLDVDAGSRWRSPKGIRHLREILETIGLVRVVITRSSNSNGIHIWIPPPWSMSGGAGGVGGG